MCYNRHCSKGVISIRLFLYGKIVRTEQIEAHGFILNNETYYIFKLYNKFFVLYYEYKALLIKLKITESLCIV